MIWSSWFRINSRMVDRLQAGRVFLGGDSAHIHSPAGAQGMNTGIQDMINLCWKLAFVLHGKAAPKLLDTYNDDRIPVIRNVLTQTEGLTDTIGSENPVFRSVFSHVAPVVVGTDLVQQNSTEQMSQLSLNYRKSPLSVSHHPFGSLRAGDRVPDLAVLLVGGGGDASQTPSPRKLFSLLHTDRFTLLFANLKDAAAIHHGAQASLSRWKPLLQTASIAPDNASGQHFREVLGTQPSIILVRPDGYAGFVGSAHSLDALTAYLEEWFPVRSEETVAHA